MKFGKKVVLEGWKVLGGYQPSTPHPRVQGVSGASAVHFGKNFIKQKLQGAPDLVGLGHLFGPQIRIWKDLGPLCASGAVLLHFQEGFITQ